MANFLEWFSSHNTLVIQSLAGVVAFLIVALIFRILFVNKASETESEAKSTTYAQLEEKLNQLLLQQKSMTFASSSEIKNNDEGLRNELDAGLVEALSSEQESSTELSRLRTEILTLKDSLKRREEEINAVKEAASRNSGDSGQEAKLAEFSKKISEYETEVGQLKNRLSDYEIVAEDLADVKKFKEENEALKNQLEKLKSDGAVENLDQTTDLSESLDDVNEITNEPLDTVNELADESSGDIDELASQSQDNVSDLTSESLDDENINSTSLEGELDALTAEDLTEEPNVPEDLLTAADDVLEEIMPEALPAEELDSDEAREVSKDVKKEEKVLLDEFEKHFAKDED